MIYSLLVDEAVRSMNPNARIDDVQGERLLTYSDVRKSLDEGLEAAAKKIDQGDLHFVSDAAAVAEAYFPRPVPKPAHVAKVRKDRPGAHLFHRDGEAPPAPDPVTWGWLDSGDGTTPPGLVDP